METQDKVEEEKSCDQDALTIEIEEEAKDTPNALFSWPSLSKQHLKYMSLIFLTLQNAILVPALRYSRVRDVSTMYLTSASVVVGECTKLAISLVAVFCQEGFSVTAFAVSLKDNIIKQPMDTLKISGLSCIYVVTNNLVYIGVSYLDAATYQVSVQLRILTTAMWSVIIFQKKLSSMQWFSLLLLAGGVALVQIQHSNHSNHVKDSNNYDAFKGILAVAVASFMSGFAGVYYELVLKSTPQSIWIRNVQLGSVGIVLSTIAAYAREGPSIIENGILQGFDAVVWTIIFWNAIGAFLTVMAVKYADNILKGFATSVAIVISSLISVQVFNFDLNVQFIIGARLVILSIYFYNRFAIQAKVVDASVK